jgi:hypothetical protein
METNYETSKILKDADDLYLWTKSITNQFRKSGQKTDITNQSAFLKTFRDGETFSIDAYRNAKGTVKAALELGEPPINPGIAPQRVEGTDYSDNFAEKSYKESTEKHKQKVDHYKNQREEYKDLEKKVAEQEKAMGILIQSLSPTYQRIVEKDTCAGSGIDKIYEECAKHTNRKLSIFRKTVHDMKYDGKDVTHSINSLEDAIGRIRVFGGQFLDDEMVSALMNYFASTDNTFYGGQAYFTGTLNDESKKYEKVKEEYLNGIAVGIIPNPEQIYNTTKSKRSVETAGFASKRSVETAGFAKKENGTNKRVKYETICHICKHPRRGHFHLPNDCFDDPKNAHRRPEWYKDKMKKNKVNSESGNMAHETHNRRNITDEIVEYANMMEEHSPPNKAKRSNYSLYSTTTDDLIVDSGCTSHMIKSPEFFTKHKEYRTPVRVANNHVVYSVAIGSSYIADGNGMIIELKDTLLVPDLAKNLMSVKKITKDGYKVIFGGDLITFEHMDNPNLDLQGSTSHEDGLYHLHSPLIEQDAERTEAILFATQTPLSSLTLWHHRMGHTSFDNLIKMKNAGVHECFDINTKSHTVEKPLCYDCISGKMTNKYSKEPRNRATKPGEIIHVDLCGPLPTPSIEGYRYFLVMIDDLTSWNEVIFLANKSEFSQHVITYHKRIRAKGYTTRFIRSDNELRTTKMETYCKENGIQQQFTLAHSSDQNGVAERKNLTLMNSARTLLLSANQDDCFWVQAIAASNYIQNRIMNTTTKSDKTPFELWNNRKPNIKNLRIYGCSAIVHIKANTPDRDKLQPRGKLCTFLGYAGDQKGWIFLTQEGRIITSNNAIFDEFKFIREREAAKTFEINDEKSADSYLQLKTTEDSVENKLQLKTTEDSVENKLPNAKEHFCKRTLGSLEGSQGGERPLDGEGPLGSQEGSQGGEKPLNGEGPLGMSEMPPILIY